ncbi:hypothetical protein VNI00_017655 [Paramarasmius palmivorus]|uniref:DUF6535 domain-containing protein n=1 Tax=Paramarasmius palmivorus TaxID=297713 RepID=A0AAW0B545_9AGAR
MTSDSHLTLFCTAQDHVIHLSDDRSSEGQSSSDCGLLKAPSAIGIRDLIRSDIRSQSNPPGTLFASASNEEPMEMSREDIDTLMVFGALFTILITTFFIGPYRKLKKDPIIVTIVLLQSAL